MRRDEHALTGSPVAEVIIDLPLRRGTPGYNLAYAEFSLAGNAWRRFTFHDRLGRRRPVEILVKALRFGPARAFFVHLRSPGEGSEISEDLAHLIAVADESDEGVVILSTKGVIDHVNPAYEAMTGVSRRDALGTVPHFVGSRFRNPERHPEFWRRLSQGSEVHYAGVNRRKNGEWYFAAHSIRPFVDRQGRVTHFVSRQRDLGHQDDARGKLMQMAYFDALTGLPNRNLFFDRLHQEIARAGRTGAGFTLLLLDVDAFKAVNDTFGHAAGDILLRELSARLKCCVRESDTVARLGGDEFAIILTELTDQTHVTDVLNKIRRLGCADVTVEGMQLPVSVSIGAAIYPKHGESDDRLMKAADQAMYEAKRAQSVGWCYFDAEGQTTGT